MVSLEWEKEESFPRMTTRAPPSQGRWGEFDFDEDLLGRFMPAEAPYRPRDRPSSSRDPTATSSRDNTVPEGHRPDVNHFGDQSHRKSNGDVDADASDLGSLLSDRQSTTPSDENQNVEIAEIADRRLPPIPVEKNPSPVKDLPPIKSDAISPESVKEKNVMRFSPNLRSRPCRTKRNQL